MKYFLHTLMMAQRRPILEDPNRLYVLKDIRIDDFLGKTLAIDEDRDELYEVDYEAMMLTLRQFDQDTDIDPKKTRYYYHWIERKGSDYCIARVKGFHELYESIKAEGLKEPVAVTSCGQKMDGSHRASIMKHLGHDTIPAKEYTLSYKEIDSPFLERTARARSLLFGDNYYFIDFGGFANMERRPVYHENSYERWEVLKDLVGGGKIIDLGCNEGFISLMCAKQGAFVQGYDHEFIEGANFHKLAFDLREGLYIPAVFSQSEIHKMDFPACDTALLLNVIYHLPQEEQIPVLSKLRKSAKRLIMQGNLRKAHEVERFRGCTVETMRELLEVSGWNVEQVIEWRDKPIIVAV